MRSKGLTIAGLVLVVLGVAFAVLDKEWIEENLGFEPDGGSGALELLLAIVPIAAGIALLAYVWLRRPAGEARRRPTTEPPGSPP